MTSKEIVRRSLYFNSPPRLPYCFPDNYGTDFMYTGLDPSPDARCARGTDEWGCIWDCISGSSLGEVKDSPLKDWGDFDKLSVPDATDENRYAKIKTAREEAGDKYIIMTVSSIYERVHFLRGFANAQTDIAECPENIRMLVDLLTDMNLDIIKLSAGYDIDAIIMWDDWGLQDRLMIRPAVWREIWKPSYKRIYDAAHNAGMDVFLHSCGHIVEILDDLIEIGLDAIHMDQQENMGLKLLGRRFGGRLNFFSPVDIQKTMASGSPDEIRAYCREMWRCLGTKKGGFIPRWYPDPNGAGHKMDNVNLMCEEFLKINKEEFGK